MAAAAVKMIYIKHTRLLSAHHYLLYTVSLFVAPFFRNESALDKCRLNVLTETLGTHVFQVGHVEKSEMAENGCSHPTD
jgi:hypothetical protein